MDGIEGPVLFLGDGNFSFSLSVAEKYKSISVTATCFESEEQIENNKIAFQNVNRLKSLENAIVYHRIDATKLNQHFTKRDHLFKRIFFNFPHVGGKSNIKKCRALLKDFFHSCTNRLDVDGGLVCVSLCQGQGGIPIDRNRNSYKNSWQVVTMAADAGFYLVKVTPFRADQYPKYQSVGYRGRLHRGFLNQGALTYHFKFGKSLTQDINDDVKRTSLTPPEVEQLSFSNITSNVKSALRHDDHPLYILLEKLNCVCSTILASHGLSIRKYDTLTDCTNSLLIANNYKSSMSLTNDFISHGKGTMRENSVFDLKKEIERHDDYYTVINAVCFDIWCNPSPLSHTVCPEFVMILNGDDINTDNFINDVINNLSSMHSSNDNLNSQLNPETFTKSDLDGFPSFVNQIDNYTYNYKLPITTISKETDSNNKESISYTFVDYSTEDATAIEHSYCSKTKGKSFCDLLGKENYVKLNGTTIATYGSPKDSVTNSADVNLYGKTIVVFDVNQIFRLCYGVEDLRLLWSNDEFYLKKLSNFVNQLSTTADRQMQHPTPSLLYPLAYRHDLCFWLNESSSVEHLTAAIHYILDDLVYGLYLIRVLRHMESNLVSYCYRLVYSRCDGPLTHLQTVNIQNHLRQMLLAYGFDLR